MEQAAKERTNAGECQSQEASRSEVFLRVTSGAVDAVVVVSIKLGCGCIHEEGGSEIREV